VISCLFPQEEEVGIGQLDQGGYFQKNICSSVSPFAQFGNPDQLLFVLK
jgi:hypothetical protein